MFGGDFQATRNVTGYQLLHILMCRLVEGIIIITMEEQVVAHSASDERFLDSRNLIYFFI